MRHLLTIFSLLYLFSCGHAQQLNLSDTTKLNLIQIADDSSFEIIKNDINIIIDNDFKRKIEFYRKDFDYIWKPEDGLEILIYKK